MSECIVIVSIATIRQVCMNMLAKYLSSLGIKLTEFDFTSRDSGINLNQILTSMIEEKSWQVTAGDLSHLSCAAQDMVKSITLVVREAKGYAVDAVGITELVGNMDLYMENALLELIGSVCDLQDPTIKTKTYLISKNRELSDLCVAIKS